MVLQKNIRFSLMAAGVAALGSPALAQTRAVADLLIIHAHVFGADPAKAFDAIAVRHGRIVAVGDTADILKRRSVKSTIIDAAGRAVLPGLDDNHVHLTMGAHTLNYPDVRHAPDLPAIQSILREEARAHPKAVWLQLGGWLPDQLPGKRPTAQMLDAVVPDRPVVMWTLDRHGAWLNSKALAALNITDATPDPRDGIIGRDDGGHATGWFKEFGAVRLVEAGMPKISEEGREALLTRAFEEAHRYGVTTLTEALGTQEEYLRLERMEKKGRLPMRVTYAIMAHPGLDDSEIARMDAFWKSHPDTARLRTGTVKMFLDGVPQSDTAFLLEPWGPQHDDGQPAWKREDYFRAAKAFDRAGWQLMVHAMGDGAVRMALDGMEVAMAANPPPPRERRFRIEHAFLVNPADLARFGKLNVTAAYQPIDNFHPAGSPMAPPQARAPQDNGRWVDVARLAGRVAFGSDWPVSSLDALGRIYTVVNGPRGDQRMPAEQLIADYTLSNAYLDYAEKERGRIAPGQLADLAIVATDILANPPRSKDDIRIDATILDGQLVYARPDSALSIIKPRQITVRKR